MYIEYILELLSNKCSFNKVTEHSDNALNDGKNYALFATTFSLDKCCQTLVLATIAEA